MSTQSSAKSDAVINVENVTHLFKQHRALDGISFQVAPKSLHGFVGPNGAGKTTTLKIICTLLKPQSGRIEVFGYNVRDDVKAIRRRIGYMPDHFSMYKQMTVFEYLDFFAAAYGFSLKDRDRIVADVLALTDMDGRKDDLIQGLSRGMQQRVSLARVLVNDPDLLLLDEPASGLDPRARIELMEILRELRRMGKTIFISSHILSELAELCDSVTIVDRGKTKYSGPMDALLETTSENPVYRLRVETQNGEVDGYLDTLKTLGGVLSVDPVEGRPEYRIAIDPARTDVNGLLRNLLDKSIPIAGFSKDQRHLNEAFMDLTERGVRT
ncbi:putative ABC transporter ATP-binding protein YxlF [Caulifigura coniformis]|uniref:Putative ABC transporter ATP-binding protein YxlF n=1 Tax=Caulifigura coniformis TaxID=2527983 RepID=A0A517SAX3_9PLAN|nr:ABC transporter ATP-binding protein [Caulifigura coniformis]QDT53265.1 putative ABC transporter ATP-binding protein YxlF [Caulifigura coniformis]